MTRREAKRGCIHDGCLLFLVLVWAFLPGMPPACPRSLAVAPWLYPKNSGPQPLTLRWPFAERRCFGGALPRVLWGRFCSLLLLRPSAETPDFAS